MPRIKAIAIDDEYLALDLIADYASQTPDLDLVQTFSSAASAIESIRQSPPDLLFLDIQMPGLSGLNLLRTLRRPPATIFTTAYAQHAVEAFDLDAVDYLLKPFSFERFLQAIAKAKDHLSNREQKFTATDQSADFLVAKVDGKLVRIPFAEILYIEGLKEYVRIHTPKGRFVTLERMKNLEELLPEKDFLRIHKSYLIAKGQARSLEGNMLEVAGQQLPISRAKREAIIQLLFSIG